MQRLSGRVRAHDAYTGRRPALGARPMPPEAQRRVRPATRPIGATTNRMVNVGPVASEDAMPSLPEHQVCLARTAV